jgi:hypothetical protein
MCDIKFDIDAAFDCHTNRQTDRQTDRQTNRQPNKQTNRQINRQSYLLLALELGLLGKKLLVLPLDLAQLHADTLELRVGAHRLGRLPCQFILLPLQLLHLLLGSSNGKKGRKEEDKKRGRV